MYEEDWEIEGMVNEVWTRVIPQIIKLWTLERERMRRERLVGDLVAFSFFLDK